MKETRAASVWRMVAGAVMVAALLIPVVTASPSRAAGNTYYVATGGSDANPGSADRPWRTMQKAANTMVAGDVCTVLAGAYGERVRVSKSGSAGTPIIFRADGVVTMKGFRVEANYITIAGFDITDTDNDNVDGFGVFLRGSYCIIEGNYMHYCTRGGISMYVEPHDSAAVSNCIIRNNRLYKNAMAGIQVFGRNHLVEGNEVWGTIQYHPKWTNPPGYVDADGMRFFGTGHTFRGNYIHDIGYNDRENVNPHIDGFQTWGPAYDITFEQNTVDLMVYQTDRAVGQGFMVEEQASPVRDLTIRNNVIRVFRSNFMACEGLQFLHNVFESFLSAPLQGYYPIILHSSPAATVKNNIFYNVGDGARCLYADGTSPQGLVMDYNCVYRNDGKAPAGTASPHDLWNLAPRFVNAAAGDFHLQPGSPCIDAGTPLAQVTSDMDGTTRPQGSGYDIGAYEYTGGAASATATAVAASPTPTRTLIPSVTPEAAAETTVVLQQGSNGYGGAQDTHMEQYSATTNFSGQDAFRVGYKQTLAGLLQFDVSSIPQGASVSSAQLQVYATGWGGVNISIGAYALSRKARLIEATWNQASTGEAWGLAGCNDTNTDRRGMPESIVTTNGIGKWYTFDVTALVREWGSGGLSNNGLLLRQTTTAAYRFLFASAEKADVTLRPKLVVSYRGGAAPAPSATPTATTHATATPTVTTVASATPTVTVQATATPTATTVASATPTATTPATATPTATASATATPTATAPATATPTATASATATSTATALATATPTAASASTTSTATATATPAVYGADTTVTLRQGESGYTGAQDSWISADDPTANYCAEDLLKVGYRQKYAPLLRFDLSSIPADSTVVAAKLEVWATGWSGANLTIAAHAVLRHASSSQVTWRQARAGNPWGLPGCDDVVTDRRLNAESTLTTSGIRKWYAFDLANLVQEWVSGGLANEGVLLRQSIRSDRSMWLASAENPVSDNRPKLVVTYR